MRNVFRLSQILSDFIIGRVPGYPRLYDTGSLSNGIRCMVDISQRQGIRVFFDTRGSVYRNPDNPRDRRNGQPVDYLIYNAWSRKVALRFFAMDEVNDILFNLLSEHFAEQNQRDPTYSQRFVNRFSAYTLDDTHGQIYIYGIDRNGVVRERGR